MLRDVTAETTRTLYVGPKAKRYDTEREHQFKWRNEHLAVSDFLSDAKGSVLDIPVGTGRFLFVYERLGLRVIGMDVSADMLSVARAKVPSADLRLGDIFKIGLPDRSIDNVVCIRLLNLMTDLEMVDAITELGRVARERIVLSIRTGTAKRRKPKSWTHSHDTFERVVRRIGMTIVASRAAEGSDYRVYLLKR